MILSKCIADVSPALDGGAWLNSLHQIRTRADLLAVIKAAAEALPECDEPAHDDGLWLRAYRALSRCARNHEAGAQISLYRMRVEAAERLDYERDNKISDGVL